MPPELNFAERRVLGVLIEKCFTTPEQYPLTLNSLVSGCNQKSCREPASNLGEDEVLDALESLRGKSLVTLVRSMGGRTDRYRHRSGETLSLEGRQAAVIAELLLRGPQTDGELRQRASRMVPIATLDELAEVIEDLRRRESAYVVRLGPEGRRRGTKYAHTFYRQGERPESDTDGDWAAAERRAPPSRPEAPAWEEESHPSSRLQAPAATATTQGLEELRAEVERLRERVEELETTFMRFFR